MFNSHLAKFIANKQDENLQFMFSLDWKEVKGLRMGLGRDMHSFSISQGSYSQFLSTYCQMLDIHVVQDTKFVTQIK